MGNAEYIKQAMVVMGDEASVVKLMDEESLVNGLRQVLGSLSETDRRVLELRYGLQDECFRTFREVASSPEFQFNTDNRANQIHQRGIRLLRHPANMRQYLNEAAVREFQRIRDEKSKDRDLRRQQLK